MGIRALRGAVVAIALLCGWLGTASANIIQDGNFALFSTSGYNPSGTPPTIGSQITNSNLPDWQWVNQATPSDTTPASGNYGFVLDGTSLGSSSVYQQFDAPTTKPGTNVNTVTSGTRLGFYGVGQATNSTIPRDAAGSTHAYIADGLYQQAYLYQPVSLVTGVTYVVSFYMAAGQQVGYTLSGTAGALHGYLCGNNCSSNDFTVGLGNCGTSVSGGCTTTNSKVSSIITLQNGQGWFGASSSQWLLEQLTFVAQAGETALWFLAESSTLPSCQPPFVLLSDVSMVPLPEPPAYGVLLVALLGFLGLRRIRRRKS